MLDGSTPNMPNFDVSKTKPLVCVCGNHTFQQVSFLRIVPALLAPTLSPKGKDVIIPLMTFACNACGAVPDEVVPPFMRQSSDVPTEPTPSKITLVK